MQTPTPEDLADISLCRLLDLYLDGDPNATPQELVQLGVFSKGLTEPPVLQPPTTPSEQPGESRPKTRLLIPRAMLACLVVVAVVVAVAMGTQAVAKADFERREHERTVRNAAHESTVADARKAARTGDWTAAVRFYDAGIADGMADSLDLRVERLSALMANGDEPILTRELADLRGRLDLGRLAVQVALIDGVRLLGQPATRDAGLTAVRRALATPADLSPADVAFAEALLADKPVPTIAALRRAVGLDPFHHSAQASLVLALFAAGRPELAATQAEEMAKLFPHSAVPPLALSLIDAAQGRRDVMKENLDLGERRLGRNLAAFRRYAAKLADLFDEASASKPDAPTGLVAVPRFWKELIRIQASSAKAYQPLSTAAPTVIMIEIWYKKLLDEFPTGLQLDQADFARLVDLGRDYPDVMILSLIAGKRLREGWQAFSKSDLDKTLESFSDSAKAALNGAQGPSMFIRAPLRYETRAVGVMANIILLKLDPDPARSDERLLQVWENVYPLAAEGQAWSTTRGQTIDLALTLLTSKAPEKMTERWKIGTPDGDEAFRQRNRELYQFAFALATVWKGKDPKNKTADLWLNKYLPEWETKYVKITPKKE